MNLKDILTAILNIAGEIENNTLSYSLKPLVKAGKRKNPADLLTEIAARFTSDITKNITPNKKKIQLALQELKKIAKDYDIDQLRRPIKELSAFLSNLEGIA